MLKTSLIRFAIASLLVLCSVTLCARAQSQTNQAAKGVVAGKVTIKGKPAPGVFVSLRLRDSDRAFGSTFKATTDQDGNYRITNVSPGTYVVAPKAAAFVVSTSNTIRNEVVVVLNEGETVDGIDFALLRGGVITGKVTDSNDRPVVAQRISLTLPDPRAMQRGPIYGLVAETDDRGIYRIFGIPAGRYFVSYGMDPNGFYMAFRGRVSYRKVFYPNVSEAEKATAIGNHCSTNVLPHKA